MVTDDEIQEAILKEACDIFRERGWATNLRGGIIREEVAEELDVDEDLVGLQIQRLGDNDYIDYTPSNSGGMFQIRSSGIEKFEQLSGETVIPDNHCEKVLEVLYNQERKSPKSPHVSRDDLKQKTGLEDVQLDSAVWHLNEQRFADAATGISSASYTRVRIEERGRQIYQRLSKS